MNTDKKINHYSERMLALCGKKAAKRLKTTMSQMLETKCTKTLVWQYAKREIKAIENIRKG